MVGTAALAAGTAAPAAAQTPASVTPSADTEPLLTLTATEHAFIVAAVDTFIDRQLAGAYGTWARLYRQGPFPKAKPELGYQLALNPREFFRAGIEQANAWTRKTYGKDFDRLSEQDRESALK